METTKPRGKEEVPGSNPGAGVSKLKLALGAAGLFLFIVGVKRSFRPEQPPAGDEVEHEPSGDARARGSV